MRVLQLIDSLDAGGAERMAVSLANGLVQHVDKSFLCTSRKEGLLKEDIDPSVGYLFLKKKNTIDPGAILRLRSYIKKNNITVIHAHTTSFFLAAQVKMVYPKISLIWHAHYGNRITTGKDQNKALYLCSRYFNGIITVNEELKHWCLQTLQTKRVEYLPNFVSSESIEPAMNEGLREDTIVCVANLKTPKNHMNLLQAFKQVNAHYPKWRLQLVGKDFKDDYASVLDDFCKEHGLNEAVERLGQRSDVAELLQSASIGVLSSDSEGLPMALLEYGAAGLAVVTTDVGHCREVIAGYGKLAPPKDSDALAKALIAYISDEKLRKEDAQGFKGHILEHYTTGAVIPKLLNMY